MPDRRGVRRWTSSPNAAVPLGYKAAPEDIANDILWLASDESRYVTGTELVIDGGRSIGWKART